VKTSPDHLTVDDAVWSIDSFLVESGSTKRWLFVKVTTSDGVVGWGECYTAPDREKAMATEVDSVGAHLIGRSIFELRNFLFIAYRDIATLRGSLEFYSVISGLEQALWDIIGKTLGQPIYNLLGGPMQSEFRLYANGWCYQPSGALHDEAVLLERAQQLAATGFTAFKLDPFAGPWRISPDKDEIAKAMHILQTLREGLDPSVDILVEGHRRFSPMVASRIAKRMEQFDPFWFEEPVECSYLAGLREVREQTSTPIVTGEALYGANAFRDVFAERAVDIINPDVGSCGGILELTTIAAMAEAHMVAVSPHCYNSTSVGFAATLQASAVMSNFLITEYFVNFVERSDAITKTTGITVANGVARLDGRPGLGLELDEDALRHASGDAVQRTFSMSSATSNGSTTNGGSKALKGREGA
jgi:galactonate dehydratase